MKFKKFATIMLTTASVIALAACGNKAKDSGDSNKDEGAKSDLVTEIKGDTTVTFWHAMNGAQEKALTKITDDFMKANPKIKIELQNQSSYGDLQKKVQATFTDPKNLPTITQAYPGWLYDAAESDLLVDLKPFISDKTIGWGDQEKIKQSLLEGAQINDKQYGIPFNKSTEILVYNKDMFDKYGVKVPTNFEELAEVSKTIYEKSNKEVVGMGFDSLNNYYAIGMKNAGISLTKKLDFASKESKDVVEYYAKGIREGYFRTAGDDKYLSGPFANGKVAMFVGSMAGEGYVAKDTAGKFEYGVAPRPAKINIQQGTDIYMFNRGDDEKTKAQQTAAFLFMKYLATPEVQLYWAQETGYMPILDSVINSEEYQNSTKVKTPKILAEATKDLFAIPVTQNADPAYRETSSLLEAIFAKPDQDIDKALEAGQVQLQDVWNQ